MGSGGVAQGAAVRSTADVEAFVKGQNYPDADMVMIMRSEANPYLLRAIKGEPVEHFEVVAQCHPDCVFETLHDVKYCSNGWQCLVAEATCGRLVVWMD